MNNRADHDQCGYTIAELVIVIGIICIIAGMLLLVNWRRSVYRAQDARRKTDVANIRRAFEEYYNDHECYPPADTLDTCGSGSLSPYLSKIPCDPASNTPYKYKSDSDTNMCVGNRVCTQLKDMIDPDIKSLGCNPVTGCGWGAGWNYCLATGTTVTAPGFDSGSSSLVEVFPTPVRTFLGVYACRPGTILGSGEVISGACNDVGDPSSFGCPASFSESDCQNHCGNVNYWCAQ